MTRDVADDMLKYIENTIDYGDTVEVCWFGGEPLMNQDIIDYMTPKIKELYKEKRAQSQFSMISDGSLITREIADKIRNTWSIGFVQITLDGYGMAYNTAKDYNDSNRFCFQSIINSIKFLAEQNVKI